MVNTQPPPSALAIPSNGNHPGAGGLDADGSIPGEDVEPPICGYYRGYEAPITRKEQRVRRHGGTLKLGWLLLAVLLAAMTTVGSAASVGSTPVTSTWKASTLTKRQEASTCACKTEEKHDGTFVVEAIMIPVLVVLSGIFAGLTLGYMSLDATQLSVLAKSGTEKQKRLAKRIMPIRKNGHLLLMTLIIANMICNEILPIVADPVLGGGVQAVVVSTILIVVFAEVIPQSVCSRFGLQVGAYCVWPVRCLIYLFYPVSWPVAKLLTKILGPHSGIIYRRAELKELVSLHGATGEHGGDLNRDVVTIVGATLDLQEKRVRDAMTPITKCFMLDVDSRLDYETLGRVMQSGHSRIPVYEERPVEDPNPGDVSDKEESKPLMRRKILGVLLTKQLILIDPEDGVPLRGFPLHPLPLVPDVMPLLNILNSFQEGRSHLAIVCPRKPGFYNRPNVGPQAATSTRSHSGSGQGYDLVPESSRSSNSSGEQNVSGDEGSAKHRFTQMFRRKRSRSTSSADAKSLKSLKDNAERAERGEMDDIELSSKMALNVPLEEDMPMGIITLEDVIEELLGEEILDETDQNEMGETAVRPYVPEEAVQALQQKRKPSVMAALRPGKSASTPPPMTSVTPTAQPPIVGQTAPAAPVGVLKSAANRLTLGGMNRSRSAPGKSRVTEPASSQEGSPKPPVLSEKSPAAGAAEAATASIKAKDYANAASVVAPVAVDPSLPQISEARSDAGSDGEQVNEKDGAAAEATEGTQAPNVLSPVAVPPRLSDAIMLERGRRVLARQGVDPNVTLRLASPQSSLTPGSPAPETTPVISVGSQAPGTPGAGPKGAFKLPARKLSVPQRSYTGTPRTSNVGGLVDSPGRVTPAASSAPSDERRVQSPAPIGGTEAPLVESPEPKSDPMQGSQGKKQ